MLARSSSSIAFLFLLLLAAAAAASSSSPAGTGPGYGGLELGLPLGCDVLNGGTDPGPGPGAGQAGHGDFREELSGRLAPASAAVVARGGGRPGPPALAVKPKPKPAGKAAAPKAPALLKAPASKAGDELGYSSAMQVVIVVVSSGTTAWLMVSCLTAEPQHRLSLPIPVRVSSSCRCRSGRSRSGRSRSGSAVSRGSTRTEASSQSGGGGGGEQVASSGGGGGVPVPVLKKEVVVGRRHAQRGWLRGVLAAALLSSSASSSLRAPCNSRPAEQEVVGGAAGNYVSGSGSGLGGGGGVAAEENAPPASASGKAEPAEQPQQQQQQQLQHVRRRSKHKQQGRQVRSSVGAAARHGHAGGGGGGGGGSVQQPKESRGRGGGQVSRRGFLGRSAAAEDAGIDAAAARHAHSVAPPRESGGASSSVGDGDRTGGCEGKDGEGGRRAWESTCAAGEEREQQQQQQADGLGAYNNIDNWAWEMVRKDIAEAGYGGAFSPAPPAFAAPWNSTYVGTSLHATRSSRCQVPGMWSTGGGIWGPPDDLPSPAAAGPLLPPSADSLAAACRSSWLWYSPDLNRMAHFLRPPGGAAAENAAASAAAAALGQQQQQLGELAPDCWKMVADNLLNLLSGPEDAEDAPQFGQSVGCNPSSESSSLWLGADTVDRCHRSGAGVPCPSAISSSRPRSLRNSSGICKAAPVVGVIGEALATDAPPFPAFCHLLQQREMAAQPSSSSSSLVPTSCSLFAADLFAGPKLTKLLT